MEVDQAVRSCPPGSDFRSAGGSRCESCCLCALVDGALGWPAHDCSTWGSSLTADHWKCWAGAAAQAWPDAQSCSSCFESASIDR